MDAPHQQEKIIKPKLVILGTGFGALSLIKKVNADYYDIHVISPRNHFLFTPLLPSTTVGTIEFRSIIEPIRAAKEGIKFYLAEATGIDAQQKIVTCKGAIDGEPFQFSYDYLVITVGAISNTYGIPGVKEYALFLKDIADARAIRQKIIDCFEMANTPGLIDDERKRLLHFLVVGGGPTGVEFAAEMHDFLIEDLYKWFPQQIHEFQITILEATTQILSTFDASLSEYTINLFKRQRIQVRTRSPVKEVGKEQVILQDGTAISYGLIVWATGNGPTPFVESLPFPKDRASCLLTDDFFHVAEVPYVYAIGDCATVIGKNMPATAQVAQQQGKYLGKIFNRLAQNKLIFPFEYRHMGMLAYVGGKKALADLPNIKGRGFSAYLFWRSAYLTRLVSLKNKILVLFDWFKTAIFGRDISRF